MTDKTPNTPAPFRMVITEIYMIKARGVVVVGDIESGAPKKNQAITITGHNKTLHGSIAGIHINPSNKSIGILLKSIRRDDVQIGMVITTEGTQDRR